MLTLTETQARARIAELAHARPMRPYLLGIVGEPGAGKSTLAESAGVPTLPMDGYHFANEHLERLGMGDRKGAPETFDVAGYAYALIRLRAGEDVVVPRFDRTLDEAIAGSVPLSADSPLIVTEGNYLLLDRGEWRSVRPLLDEVWFIQVDQALRKQRLIQRHQLFGKSTTEATRWVAQVDEPNAAIIRSVQYRADAVINRLT
jgi:pantothenate kinase